VGTALGPGSATGRLLVALLDRGDLVASLETLAEVEEVLARPKFPGRLPREVRQRFVSRLAPGARIVEPGERVADCRDPRDDKLIEAALAAGAAVIVSDDRDLLTLAPWRGIRVVKPEAALAELDSGR
jgi:uncharacterized protein